jgi:hypothetical protein
MTVTKNTTLIEALFGVFTSPNVSDSNFEPANLVDVGDRIGDALWKLARTGDLDGSPGTIEAHGDAIKEAAGVIAEALGDVADAIRSLKGT